MATMSVSTAYCVYAELGPLCVCLPKRHSVSTGHRNSLCRFEPQALDSNIILFKTLRVGYSITHILFFHCICMMDAQSFESDLNCFHPVFCSHAVCLWQCSLVWFQPQFGSAGWAWGPTHSSLPWSQKQGSGIKSFENLNLYSCGERDKMRLGLNCTWSFPPNTIQAPSAYCFDAVWITPQKFIEDGWMNFIRDGFLWEHVPGHSQIFPHSRAGSERGLSW